MDTLYTTSIVAAIISLLVMPLLTRLALRFQLVDKPDERKVHTRPIPRIGGVGIFLSFSITLALAFILRSNHLHTCVAHPHYFLFAAGGLLAFAVGLFDDIKGIRARYKLMLQIVAATLAYFGGIRIESIGLHDVFMLDLGLCSTCVSIFWIVLVINAINLIDGLDGLAGGISLLAAAFLCYISFLGNRSGVSLLMAILCGSLIGFLRYNFNPASIFMGDGGSYFLGYMLGTCSILSAVNHQSTFTVLIPMLILALPVIDVTMATVRRFIHGKNIFDPDKKHFHHMLLHQGLSHRMAVIVLYGAAIFISCLSILLIKLHDINALYILALMAILTMVGIKRLGYFKHYDKSALLPWLNSVGYEIGLNPTRRKFFDLQIQITASKNYNELWDAIEKALRVMGFISGAIYLSPSSNNATTANNKKTTDNRRKTPALYATVTLRQTPPDWHWINEDLQLDEHNRSLFRVEMELQDLDSNKLGTLLLINDQTLQPLGNYTLKHVEHFRRSIVKALITIQNNSAISVPQERRTNTVWQPSNPLLPLEPSLAKVQIEEQILTRSKS